MYLLLGSLFLGFSSGTTGSGRTSGRSSSTSGRSTSGRNGSKLGGALSDQLEPAL